MKISLIILAFFLFNCFNLEAQKGHGKGHSKGHAKGKYKHNPGNRYKYKKSPPPKRYYKSRPINVKVVIGK